MQVKDRNKALPKPLRPDRVLRQSMLCRLRLHNFVPTDKTGSFAGEKYQQDVCSRCGRLRQVAIGWDIDELEYYRES